MTRTSNARANALIPLATVLVLLGTSAAKAEMPRPTGSTPTMIGGQVIGAGHLVLGAATGYPETEGRVIFGMSQKFDLGIFAGLTYGHRGGRGRGNGHLAGNQQGLGLDLQVPLRFTLMTKPKAALALRVVPYFRIGEASPAFGVGGILGVRVSIALPKLFSILVGADSRFGFGSWGGDCGPGVDCRDNFFDGATYAVLGLESFINNKWFVNLQFDAGGWYGHNPGGGHGLFNARVGFGAMLH